MGKYDFYQNFSENVMIMHKSYLRIAFLISGKMWPKNAFYILIFWPCKSLVLRLEVRGDFKVRTLRETHKIWKNIPHGFDKSADSLSKRQNHEEDFFQIMCASQKVRTLTNQDAPLNTKKKYFFPYNVNRISY